MSAEAGGDAATGRARTVVERVSARELVVRRTVDGPARLVFEAWTRPVLFRRWWAPKSFDVFVVSVEMDVRTGGSYRLQIGVPSTEQPLSFFGRYTEVTPPARLVWTNEEAGVDGAITTVTFEEEDGATRIVVHELYPSESALDEAIASGSTSGWGEQFEQLDDLVPGLAAGS